jgi:hypothetical protein
MPKFLVEVTGYYGDPAEDVQVGDVQAALEYWGMDVTVEKTDG